MIHRWIGVLLCFCFWFQTLGITRADDLSLGNLSERKTDGLGEIGVKECAACHSAPSPIYEQLKVTRFIRLVEAKEWFERDKHAYAFHLVRQDLPEADLERPENKSNKLSVEIRKRLKWPVGQVGDAMFQAKCLTCHAGVDLSLPSPSQEVLQTNLQFGVQCEACHGPGSEYTKTDQHQQVSWRAKTPAEKSKLGMWDLASPSTCADVCLSCHLGSITQGRFVSHDMYAAGHPPLPPFDLQTFLDAMPPHWQTIQNKPYQAATDKQQTQEFVLQSEYYLAHYDLQSLGPMDKIEQAIKSSYDRTRRSMIGGLVANDNGIKLIHAAAAQAQVEPNNWGDFSMYDCMGCHQELSKSKVRWRPDSRIPGRAFPSNWLSLEHPSLHKTNASNHDRLTNEMFAAFNSVPFGDAKKLAALSNDHLVSLADRFRDRNRMERQIMSEADVKHWLQVLLADREEKLTDYWMAKQTAWMVTVAVKELVDHGVLSRNAIQANLDELSQLLSLNLQIPPNASVLDAQKSTLEIAGSFDAVRCRTLIRELVETALSTK